MGIWWSGSWRAPDDAAGEVAAEMEDLGYGALWSSGGFQAGLASRFGRLLAATTRVVVASGIVSIWAAGASDISGAVADLDAAYPGRFLLGLGASHSAVVSDYSRPFARMVSYLDELDAAGDGAERPPGARRPRTAHAGAGREPGGRGPSVLRPRRAHGPGPATSSATVRCWPRR